MSISPISLGRVSQNMRSFLLTTSLRGTQSALLTVQNQLASGLRFQRPSEDPLRAAAALRIDRQLDLLSRVEDNVRKANTVLSEGEAAMQEAVSLMTEANTLALNGVNDGVSSDERYALATVVDSLLEQMIALGNRSYNDEFLFSGHFGRDLPFVRTQDGVLFQGDAGRRQTIVDTDLSQDTFTISGMEFFSAVSTEVQGWHDLNPALTLDTRISDLNGANGGGVSLGRVRVENGPDAAEIDLSGAATVGDVIDRLNAEMPPPLEAALTTDGIQIVPQGLGPAQIIVTDVEGGSSANDLGIFTNEPLPVVLGGDLDPRLTARTSLDALNAGAGLTLESGIVITNGGRTATIDFSGATTLEDVINRIDQADLGVMVDINADGTSLNVRSRVSGATLTIGENGGTDATELGIRSMFGGTRLTDLNQGRGVSTVDGDDFRITTADGTTVDVDLDVLDLTTATLDDLITLLNTRSGGAFTASLTANGNGLAITDNTAGPGSLSISKLNLSPALEDLGLNASAGGGVLIGDDVNGAIVDGPFAALIALRDALEADDTRAINDAAQRVESALTGMQRIQGQLAAKAQSMVARETRLEMERTAAELLLSDVQDTDITEALVQFQQLQTALQANMQTAGQILSLSLLDYL